MPRTATIKREQVSSGTPASQVDGEVSSVEANASAQKLERREQPTAAVEVMDEKQKNKEAVSPTAVMKREPVSTGTPTSQVDGEVSLVEANASAQKLEKQEQPTAAVEVTDEKQQSKEAVSPTTVVKREKVSN